MVRLKSKVSLGWMLLLLGLLILSIVLFSFRSRNLMDTLNDLDVSININGVYKVTGYKIIEDSSRHIKSIFAKSDKDIIKIEVLGGLTEKGATQYITDQRSSIDSLFTGSLSPYPGILSHTLECPEEYIPKVEEEQVEDSWRIFYYLYANNRLTFGGCAEDVLAYVAVLAFIYCKDKNEVYHIEYFTPKDNLTTEYKEIIKSFKCKK